MKCNIFLIELKITTFLIIERCCNMSTYTQLSYHEREKIYRGLREQKTMQVIADSIGET